MLCYKDKTYCSYHKTCVDGQTCHRAFTKDVDHKAQAEELPVCLWMEQPECYDKLTKEK